MVNYCFVSGCGRNSRVNKHLNYYTMPKDKKRLEQWLKAAKREDCVDGDQSILKNRRICSRHFRRESIKNRILSPNAIPELCLPGQSSDEEEEDGHPEPSPHEDIICNNCKKLICGYRYKCVSCTDYDLCQKCEMHEVHPDHYMLRIPKPLKLALADNLTQKWQKFFNANHIVPGDDGSNSDSDDEPITKYAKNYDSGIDLSEDVKAKIRKEVSRVLKLKPGQKKKAEIRRREIDKTKQRQRLKNDKSRSVVKSTSSEPENVQELVFADVNEDPESKLNFPKLRNLLTQDPREGVSDADCQPVQVEEKQQPHQPVMHVKLSDDLSELLIEVTSNNQKLIYKYE